MKMNLESRELTKILEGISLMLKCQYFYFYLLYLFFFWGGGDVTNCISYDKNAVVLGFRCLMW